MWRGTFLSSGFDVMRSDVGTAGGQGSHPPGDRDGISDATISVHEVRLVYCDRANTDHAASNRATCATNMGTSVRALIATGFSISRVARETIAIYDELMP
jgi:hypothetical protein